MPYGTMSPDTREYVEKRARESGIDLEKLGLEVFEHNENCLVQVSETLNQVCEQLAKVATVDTRQREAIDAIQSCVAILEDYSSDCICDGSGQDCYDIAVIVEGGLDEDFSVKTIYEVNIADWIAELLQEQASAQGFGSWEVIVTESGDSGVVRYRCSSEGES